MFVSGRTRRTALLGLVVVVGLGLFAEDAEATDVPDDVYAVPVFEIEDPTASAMRVRWLHAALNTFTYRIRRRNVATNNVVILTPTASQIKITLSDELIFDDTTTTENAFYEYEVEAIDTSNVASGWSPPTRANSRKQVWPVPASHEILTSFGQPIDVGGERYFHKAVDIIGGDEAVQVARGGLIEEIAPTVGGKVKIRVATDGGSHLVTYGHMVQTDPVALVLSEPIEPELTIGKVNAAVFDTTSMDPFADHLHWGSPNYNRLLGCQPNADRDPGETVPEVTDVNGDGKDFIVVDSGTHDDGAERDPAWGAVDFLVDACDELTPTGGLVHAPLAIGYRITDLDGNDVVKSANDPYILFRFDDPGFIPATAAEDAVYWDLLAAATPWPTCLTWIVTHATSAANIPSTSACWRTNAREDTTGALEANGSTQTDIAGDQLEAWFPDQRYQVHIHLEDAIPAHKQDVVREVLVDNFAPYVWKCSIWSQRRGNKVYESFWEWRNDKRVPEPSTLRAANAGVAGRNRRIGIRIEFSEPMQSASLSIPTLELSPTLTSSQPTDQKRVWWGKIAAADLATDDSDDGVHMLTITGTDLAGNALQSITERTVIDAGYGRRIDESNFEGAQGSDTIHGFKIGPLRGTNAVKTLFVRHGPVDPSLPTPQEQRFQLGTWLSDYFGEVSYGGIDFTLERHPATGWYTLDNPVGTYYTGSKSPLVDLVQEAIRKAEVDGVDFSETTHVLVVTNETADRAAESTTGPWGYEVEGIVGSHEMAAGVVPASAPAAHVTNAAGRMIGLQDLFAYSNVTTGRSFVGPWSHMSNKDAQVHVLGWEKQRLGWVDADGSATGKQVAHVAKPPMGTPISDQEHLLHAIDADTDDVKVLAIEVAQDLCYTVELRRQQGKDAALPAAGVLITKANDRVPAGAGPAIVQESAVTEGDLADAPHVLTSPRDVFQDVGAGIRIAVMEMDSDKAKVSVDYDVPLSQNDVTVRPPGGRWNPVDIWVDAPDLGGSFEEDPRQVAEADEIPVIGVVNKLVGRVRNLGPADATNFEVELMVREPWGMDTPWTSLDVHTVSMLRGQDFDPNADYLIVADWTPTLGQHTCVKLRVRQVANDADPNNNWTQRNLSKFVSAASSPYAPVVSSFQVRNTHPTEPRPIFFRVEGLPDGWAYKIDPPRPVLDPDTQVDAKIEIAPADSAPLCSKERITVTAYVPEAMTLKPIDGITLDIALKRAQAVTQASWTDGGCICPEGGRRVAIPNASHCHLYTRGSTDPALPRSEVALVYARPDGTREVRRVTTDANGDYADILRTDLPGAWEVGVVVEATDCRDEARTTPIRIVLPGPDREADPCEALAAELSGLLDKLRAALRSRNVDAARALVARALSLLAEHRESCPKHDARLSALFERVGSMIEDGQLGQAARGVERIARVLARL